jgi:tRNA dimethylallyltransferase
MNNVAMSITKLQPMDAESPTSTMRRIVLLGPTGIGKTDLSIALALSLDAEIVSADSMQIYKTMDIGTAKPTAEQLRRVPHHLISYVPPGEPYNAKRYREDALKVIADIENRGKRVLVTGGTGLYLRGLLQGFLEDDGAEKIREELECCVQTEGIEPLREELKRVDFEKYRSLPPQDHRRIIRALAFFRKHQKPISSLQKEWLRPLDPAFTLIGLQMDRVMLYRRIDERVDWMMKNGLAEEVKNFMLLNIPEKAPCRQAIGYKELALVLQNQCSLADAVLLVKRESRRYAKRQLTWFRKMDTITWFSVDHYSTHSLRDAILAWILLQK